VLVQQEQGAGTGQPPNGGGSSERDSEEQGEGGRAVQGNFIAAERAAETIRTALAQACRQAEGNLSPSTRGEDLDPGEVDRSQGHENVVLEGE
jgi:hypothetical protein